ncbi:MAG: hypothetical protein ACLPHP_08435 [Candidatus Sulfotelmatobacter sp.]
MSSKILQLSPQASTRTRRKIAPQDSWSAAPARPLDMPLDLSLDMGFLPAWFESDPDPAQSSTRRVNWGAISGMALSVTFSVICWAGVAWIVTRVWR